MILFSFCQNFKLTLLACSSNLLKILQGSVEDLSSNVKYANATLVGFCITPYCHPKLVGEAQVLMPIVSSQTGGRSTSSDVSTLWGIFASYWLCESEVERQWLWAPDLLECHLLGRVDRTFWEGPFLKKSGSHIYYHKTHFIAFLNSSHQTGSVCHSKILLNPKFDQVKILQRKLTSGDQSRGCWWCRLHFVWANISRGD